MAEQQYHQATLQHLAHLQQDSVPRQGASVQHHSAETQQVALAEAGSGILRQAWLQHQQAVSEAASEAHLQKLQQAAKR